VSTLPLFSNSHGIDPGPMASGKYMVLDDTAGLFLIQFSLSALLARPVWMRSNKRMKQTGESLAAIERKNRCNRIDYSLQRVFSAI
jgi:hypothetical protein